MDFSQLFDQAQKMTQNLQDSQNEFEKKVFPFSSQGDLITGEMNGKEELLSLHIKEELLEDKDMLEDLLLLTLNQIHQKISNERKSTLNSFSNGIDVSSFL